MKKIIPLSLLALSFATVSVNAYSQENNEEEPLTIYITSQRTAEPVEEKVAAVSVITQDDILRSGAGTVAEVLRGKAGIAIDDLFGDGSESTIDIRGFGGTAGSNILVLVDGRRLNNPDTDSPNLNSIPVKNVERIEIIKGSAGSLYGDQAVGGVVNIITRPVEDFSADITTFAGSYNRRGFSANLNEVDDENYIRLFFESIKSDNYRDNSESDTQHFFSRIGNRTDERELFFEFQLDDDERELPGALLANEAEDDPQQSFVAFENDFSDTKERLLRLGLEQELSPEWTFLSEYSIRDQDTDFILNFRSCINFSCNTTPDEEERTVVSFTPRVLGNLTLGQQRVQVTAGLDIESTDYEFNTEFIDRSNDQTVESIYFHSVFPIGSSWTITTGARHSEIENDLFDDTTFPNGGDLDDNATVYSLGVAKDFVNTKIFARYDENFRFAKVDELARSSTSADLENQLGVSKEVGVDFQIQSANIELLAYQLELENEIAFDPTANGVFGPFGANINYESTRRRGISLDYQQKVSAFLNFTFNLSRIDAEFTTDGEFGSNIVAGNSISGVPELLAHLTLDYQVFDGLNVLYEINHVGEQFLSGDNDNSDDKQASYTVSNIASHYETGNWSFNVRLNNVLDKRYGEFQNSNGAVFPSPERNFEASASYNF